MKTLRYRGVPVLGFAAYSGTGKTTLLRRLLPRLITRGLRPAIVKHAHHDFDIDFPGKDSYELRKAGAAQVLVGSAHRWAMVVETDQGMEPELIEFLSRIQTANADIILVEGFRDEQFPKVEVHRQSQDRAMFYPRDPYIIALVSDAPGPHADHITSFHCDAVEELAQFVESYRELAMKP